MRLSGAAATLQSSRMSSPTTPIPTLVLVPTPGELERLEGPLSEMDITAQLVGFGPIAAAARTTELLRRCRPERVLLIGVAGSFDEERWPVGASACFESVAVDGIGVGQGKGHLSAAQVGFTHWPGDRSGGEAASGERGQSIGDRLALSTPHELPGGIERLPLLVTSCSASASKAEAQARRRRLPAASAEDMEGFAVALACALAGVPLCVLRGCSNPVGTRDKASWQLARALQSVSSATRALLESRAPWSATGGVSPA